MGPVASESPPGKGTPLGSVAAVARLKASKWHPMGAREMCSVCTVRVAPSSAVVVSVT